ncbi:aminotransferase-like domain-containing protein [Gorillibacterium timonense]|uniref:aminotransferase-like domain-containing protein n=1 Tax=Gorillibacterium timonense TaxID=1689269 RepID=UPI00071DC76C|nr:PLP-dependent aminotransferase family protein [Gorillibacterium timonense]
MHWKPNRSAELTLHEQIRHWVLIRIEQGEWPAGTRLPSQRKLAEMLEVNRSTLIPVLDELKADGILKAQMGGGTYVADNGWNLLVSRTDPNWPKRIHASLHEPNQQTIQLINEHEQDASIIRLGTGELSPELLPVAAIEQSLQAITLDARDIGYSSPRGSLALREAISRYLRENRGIQASPDCILIVSGALQALQLISVGVLEPQAVVLHEAPSYLNSVRSFHSAGMRVLSVDGGGSLTEALKRQRSNRQILLYTVPTLHNPTGRVMTNEDRVELMAACQAMRIPVIEDDVYHELLFGEAPPALKALDSSGQVLYLGSVSKWLSPGLRIGWVVAPEPVIQRLADIKMQTDYGASTIAQKVVTDWLISGRYKAHLLELRANLRKRAEAVEELLQRDYAAIAAWEKPKGGFYIWLRFHEPVVNKALFLQLLKQKVLINPGYIYDPNDDHHLRLSFAYASLADIEHGLRILRESIGRTE